MKSNPAYAVNGEVQVVILNHFVFGHILIHLPYSEYFMYTGTYKDIKSYIRLLTLKISVSREM